MDLCRRLPSKPPRPSLAAGKPPCPRLSSAVVQASDALPISIPIRHTDKIFYAIFVVSLYYLMCQWREKIRCSTPLRVLTFSEISAVVGLVASLIYLISFSGISYVQSFIFSQDEDDDDDFLLTSPASAPAAPCPLLADGNAPEKMRAVSNDDDEEIIGAVVAGKMPSYALESKLGDCRRAAGIRREALRRTAGRAMEGLPLDGFDYALILGQCCEMPVGYVQLPVGIAGPLVLDGMEYFLPMATTEGCLVASANRGCKAIGESDGASSLVLREGMTRAPAVRFATARRAAELKFFLDDPKNFETLAVMFNMFRAFLSFFFPFFSFGIGYTLF